MKLRFSGVILAASLLLNLTLLADALWLNRRLTDRAVQPVPSPAVTPEPSSRPFQWSQVESADYPSYIANLRAIGCPELTIREIIAADVSDLFAPRRGPLLAKLAGGSATAAERSQAEAALRQLGQEESSIVRRLFGIHDPIDSGTTFPAQAASPSPVRNRRPMVEDTTVAMPLVFQAVDTNALKLTETDLQTINDVRQSFLAELGANRDVNSPEYRHRWQVAQKQADSLLDGLLGRQFVLKFQEEAENQTAANRPMPSGK